MTTINRSGDRSASTTFSSEKSAASSLASAPDPSTRPNTDAKHTPGEGTQPKSSVVKKTATRRKESLREQKKTRARESILNSAAHLISTDGYAQTKMRDVAKSADMSYQTLYNYFPTKGLILQELLTRDLMKLQRITEHTLTSSDILNNKLRDLAKSYIDAIAPDDRHLWKEVCAELLKATSHHNSLLALLDEQAMHKLTELLRTAQSQGELDPHIDSATLAGVVFSLLDATLMRYLVNENLTRSIMLSTISAQLRMAVTPYLRAS